MSGFLLLFTGKAKAGGSPPGPITSFTYLRPDAVSKYTRPSGGIYTRPFLYA